MKRITEYIENNLFNAKKEIDINNKNEKKFSFISESMLKYMNKNSEKNVIKDDVRTIEKVRTYLCVFRK
jgi:hypothetical protein